MTFILNLSDTHFDNNLNAFLKFFNSNIPFHMKNDNRKVWLSLKKRFIQQHSIEKKNVLFFCKAITPDVFYGFNSNYLWLLKPTFLNRVRVMLLRVGESISSII
jgi:hypothetical protein